MSVQEGIIREARSWIGTPYRHGEGVKGSGVDCAMFLVRCGQAYGIVAQDFDPRPYPRGPFLRDDRYVRMLAPWVRRREATPEPADIALFWVGPRKAPAQSSIVIRWPLVILVDMEEGVVECDVTKAWMCDRFHSAWEIVDGQEGR